MFCVHISYLLKTSYVHQSTISLIPEGFYHTLNNSSDAEFSCTQNVETLTHRRDTFAHPFTFNNLTREFTRQTTSHVLNRILARKHVGAWSIKSHVIMQNRHTFSVLLQLTTPHSKQKPHFLHLLTLLFSTSHGSI